MALVRTELQCSLHRMANYLECQLIDLFRDLVVEGRLEDAQEITYTACSLIEKLREARAGEGGDS